MPEEMKNREGFERDSYLLCEHKDGGNMTDAEFGEAVRELAHDYKIGESEIWDELPEIYAMNTGGGMP